MQSRQRGASMLGTVIFLGLLGYGVYLGLQYIPQKIENMSIDSIFESIQKIQQEAPSRSVHEVEMTLDRLLTTNQLDHLRNNFKVYRDGDGINVNFSREWTLNLIYKEATMQYERNLALK
jgi:hypothetical protein